MASKAARVAISLASPPAIADAPPPTIPPAIAALIGPNGTPANLSKASVTAYGTTCPAKLPAVPEIPLGLRSPNSKASKNIPSPKPRIKDSVGVRGWPSTVLTGA